MLIEESLRSKHGFVFTHKNKQGRREEIRHGEREEWKEREKDREMKLEVVEYKRRSESYREREMMGSNDTKS